MARARAGAGAGDRPYRTGAVGGWTPLPTDRGVGSARPWEGREAMWGEHPAFFGGRPLRGSGVRKGVALCRVGVAFEAGARPDRHNRPDSACVSTEIVYRRHPVRHRRAGVGFVGLCSLFSGKRSERLGDFAK